MINWIKLYIIALHLREAECKKFILEKKPDIAFISFVDYLGHLFSIRENLGKLDKSKKMYDDNIFGALKYLYNKRKHKNDQDALIKSHLFICGSNYPRTYPYCYGESKVIFSDIRKVIESDKYIKDEQKERVLAIYNKHLHNKTVTNIIFQATNETLEV